MPLFSWLFSLVEPFRCERTYANFYAVNAYMSRVLVMLKNLVRAPYHRVLAEVFAVWYGHPSRGMTVIGVTGTNGKSTTVELIVKILEEAGFKVASASSVRFKVGAKERPNTLKMTMPGRGLLQKFLYDAKREGATHAVLEATSEG